ncbi:hypothetical protein KH5H1_74510 [Corallococcus caeni]|nr:hypothetical protein KH5H1_74510 [Corallococcus sp. KH5-1]
MLRLRNGAGNPMATRGGLRGPCADPWAFSVSFLGGPWHPVPSEGGGLHRWLDIGVHPGSVLLREHVPGDIRSRSLPSLLDEGLGRA